MKGHTFKIQSLGLENSHLSFETGLCSQTGQNKKRFVIFYVMTSAVPISFPSFTDSTFIYSLRLNHSNVDIIYICSADIHSK